MTAPLVTPAPAVPAPSGEPPRSPRWPHVRAVFLAKHPFCVVCGEGAARGAGLNVHHVVPFDFVVRAGRPDLELDERNLITLCEAGENHHLVVGHLGDWRSYNPEVRRDAARAECRAAKSEAIRAMKWWGEERAARPKALAAMTGEELRALGEALRRQLPA